MLGGTGAKVVDVLVKRRKRQSDSFAQIRDELWQDNRTLKETILNLQDEKDELTQKYFAVIRDRNSLKVRNLELELLLESCTCGENE